MCIFGAGKGGKQIRSWSVRLVWVLSLSLSAFTRLGTEGGKMKSNLSGEREGERYMRN